MINDQTPENKLIQVKRVFQCILSIKVKIKVVFRFSVITQCQCIESRQLKSINTNNPGSEEKNR